MESSRRTRHDRRSIAARPAPAATARDDAPADERVPLVRWSRIWIGLAMIVIAVILLLVDNAFGLYSSATSPSSTPVSAVAALGTVLHGDAWTVDAKMGGSYPSIAGKSAPAGTRYLVIAVRVVNSGTAPLTIQPRDFTLRVSGATLVAAALPGQKSGLFQAPVAPRATAEGYLLFTSPAATATGVLTLAPTERRTARPLSWRIG